ncbi:RNA recognition motif domain [Dillenia turbinata]|uniref:RNA recognition motif domain n=1 Tax=Dillenia turbinata TaxID=194707 RepID=A0AAN8US03_9MAGN
MSRKRENPYASRHSSSSSSSSSFLKRHRLMMPVIEDSDDFHLSNAAANSKLSSGVVVTGISPDTSVLDLKSRFEIYGSISRLRIDRDGVGYITFRSRESAADAVNAAVDPSVGIALDSQRLQVFWANDALPKWREAVKVSSNEDCKSSSKLLRAEVPLSRHGRNNKLSPKSNNDKNNGNGSKVDVPFKGRAIVAYDDIL